MARFRPSRLFRRSNSSKTTLTSTATGTASNYDTASVRSSSQYTLQPSPGLPPSNLQSYPPSPRPRKSASLTKLRERFAEKGAEIPESVQEQRESVLVVGEVPVQERPAEAEVLPRRSGSETLVVREKSFGEESIGKSRTPESSASPALPEESEGRSITAGAGDRASEEQGEELELEKEDIVKANSVPPALTLQEPTPVVELERKEQSVK